MGVKLLDVPKMSATADFGEKLPELVDAKELARHLKLPISWIRDAARGRRLDPPPSYVFGRYRRYDLNSPELLAWLNRQKRSSQK
jgi:hypothetical protein